ncbi:putative membrane protein [Pedobacter sp. CAN_A7]|uniref:FeoB-associated Cys-rich membrane protein n=1 Tax=Pedobacter sp. CAN_A7 TaxID=2787722 RepID=UPI0018CA6535
MDVQTILVILLFIAALFYIGRLVFRAAASKGGSCGSCNGSQCKIDFKDVK